MRLHCACDVCNVSNYAERVIPVTSMFLRAKIPNKSIALLGLWLAHPIGLYRRAWSPPVQQLLLSRLEVGGHRL